ncbi:hypothetical protein AGMMS49545_09330 [Betaproteobacteria bacterium]|nr:hypothetical protein AGMMS49545_09330 [Betaproteobacteria bacterium]GHU44161.1 hypothetical protein AGMMS50289_11870 [Betaproteobacteria bacterium]
MHRSFIILLTALALSACGTRGSLEKPAGAAPPSLYERAFGKNTPSAPPQQDAQQPDDVNTTENKPE